MARALLPGLNATNGGSSTGFTTYISSLIPTAENRWSGGNRNGWSSPEMDRLVDAFRTELNGEERVRLTIQMEKIMKDELPTLFMYFTSRPNAHVAALRGPVNCWGDGFGAIGRNIPEWYWES
jgi:peptide/nickel transport system substrate-binding protein